MVEAQAEVGKSNGALLTKLFAIVVIMFAFGFAMVPLYAIFCEILGIDRTGDGISQVVVAEQHYEIDPTREIRLEFVTSINGDTPIRFWIENPKLKVTPGKYYTVHFKAENLSNRTIIGQAVPSISPSVAAEYLEKVECFCFEQQTFKPGETLEMPVRFVINPELSEKYNSVTLAYTFFDVSDKKYRKKN